MDVLSHRAALAVAAAAVAVAAVSLVALGGGDDEPTAAPSTPVTTSAPGPTPTTLPGPTVPGPTVPGPTTPTPSRTSAPTRTPEPTTSVSRATGPRITSGRVSLRLPATWAGASTEGGPEAAAQRLYPDDPARARRAVALFQGLPASTLLLGLDDAKAAAGAAFTPNLNLLVDRSVPAMAGLERAADAEVAGLSGGFALQSRTRLDFGRVEAVRLTYRIPEPASVGVAYVVTESGVTYVLTCSFPSLSPARLRLADGSAATLSVP